MTILRERLGAVSSTALLGLLLGVPACAKELKSSASASAPPVPPSPSVSARQPGPSWHDRSLSTDERARVLGASMTLEEKLTLVTGYLGVHKSWNEYPFPEARPLSAGLVRGVPRVGFPPQWQTDAGSGVATQGEAPTELERTLLPSGILTASSWDPALALEAGAMIGSEARSTGYNVMLAGGVNLMREPGNGRNFEYGGEDPLLAGTMVGALVRGIQSNHIVSTVKHFALNDQETGRNVVNVEIDEAAARMSDLLAFQLAIEQGDPGSVMCSYNLVNGKYACQNPWLLNDVLKNDWGFRGYVMADWGAQHDTIENANGGLDQETGVREKGHYQWLDKLAAAIAEGKVPPARLDEMVQRIARTLIEKGAIDEPPQPGKIDFEAHAAVTQRTAEQGIVLLKNAGVLPLAPATRRLAVVGGHADVGVLTGGGSAQVYAPGGNAVRGLGPAHWPGPHVYARSSPLEALRAELPHAEISWSEGTDRTAAARAAAAADVAIVFVTQWTAESLDFPLTLPDGQDELVEAVSRANRRTIVVLETGGPVLLPWLERAAAVVEAWYPGSRGGSAIARVLSGAVNPSGHLPVSFPRSLEQLPRPHSAGEGLPPEQPFSVKYSEGAAVGYRWYDRQKLQPLFAFGHGLSYTRFSHEQLRARAEGPLVEASFRVTNRGARAGMHVAQLYVSPASPRAAGWEAPKRLGAFVKVDLAPGASHEAKLSVDPRLLAVYDTARHAWHITPGDYVLTLAGSSAEPGPTATVKLAEHWLPPGKGARPAPAVP